MEGAAAGPSSWRTGELVDGRYEVLAVVGHGGMGMVHRVRHREWATDLAVKSPRPDLFRHAGDGSCSSPRTGTVRIWDPRTGRCLHTFTTGHGEVAITPAPDGRFALTSGGGAPLRLWEFDWDLATSST
jgi:WD40 repeat protein